MTAEIENLMMGLQLEQRNLFSFIISSPLAFSINYGNCKLAWHTGCLRCYWATCYGHGDGKKNLRHLFEHLVSTLIWGHGIGPTFGLLDSKVLLIKKVILFQLLLQIRCNMQSGAGILWPRLWRYLQYCMCFIFTL